MELVPCISCSSKQLHFDLLKRGKKLQLLCRRKEWMDMVSVFLEENMKAAFELYLDHLPCTCNPETSDAGDSDETLSWVSYHPPCIANLEEIDSPEWIHGRGISHLPEVNSPDWQESGDISNWAEMSSPEIVDFGEGVAYPTSL